METTVAHLIGPMPSKMANTAYWGNYRSYFTDASPAREAYRVFALFIDGGWHHFQDFNGQCPNFEKESLNQVHWVGDGDSLNDEIKCEQLERMWKEVSKTKLSPKKDQSDLLAGLNWLDANLKDKSFNAIICHGLLGGRLDHQLAVIGDLEQWLRDLVSKYDKKDKEEFPAIYLLDEIGRDSVTLFTNKLTTIHEGSFSVFSPQGTKVNISGDARYKGEQIDLNPYGSRGLSNEASGSFSIESEKGSLILIKNYD